MQSPQLQRTARTWAKRRQRRFAEPPCARGILTRGHVLTARVFVAPPTQSKALKKQLDEEHARHAEQAWPSWVPVAGGLALLVVVGMVVASRLGLLPDELTL